MRVATPCGFGVEPLDGADQPRFVDADLRRQLRQGVGAVKIVRDLPAQGDTEDPELFPVVVVEDQPRDGIRHRACLGVDLALDVAELVERQGLVRETLAL